ncbi:hypothetical protein [Natronobacterium gregoryi]|uniref:Uncharacterized protein n=2 Tax=Natronobacterium gregoryi TaxID=44930 RepID=L0AN38_NATGS|nr:hypothetical protein [Natronobacterium gregoryi]AFZ74894.1 hypothetical protein Natgr_3797 [Natronobacterium gregoryi SP2]ELY67591.1 hypothetical protein C490_10981 [Natronobacterium gregoryi SP2]PLK18262.1 hypothetical protein CYV19_18375 [Natronobacterium gregoryi SP2]SFJ72877.1 hypothetical protein SAMN05443661_16712 [Natronobacterium gregoryi]
MKREGFVTLAVIALGIVFMSFVIRGIGQLLPFIENAWLVSIPVAIVGFLLLVYLFVRATLDAVGIWEVH